MAKIRIEDEADIKPHIKAKNLPNPHLIFGELKNILVQECGINEGDIDEGMYEHNKEGKKEIIHSEIKAWKTFDKFTKMILKIKIALTLTPYHKKDIEFVGDVDVKIKGIIQTEYPQKTPIQKSILWDAFRAFYEKVLYGDLKEKYMGYCKSRVIVLRDEIKSFFDLLPKSG